MRLNFLNELNKCISETRASEFIKYSNEPTQIKYSIYMYYISAQKNSYFMKQSLFTDMTML